MRGRRLLAEAMAYALFTTVSLGCASTQPPAWEEPGAMPASDAVPTGPETADAAPTTPPEVQEALLPSLSLPAPSPPAEPRFDVAVHDVPATSFFLDLVEGTPYDMVVHPDVKGNLSLTLRDATVPEILETVSETYGYGFRPLPTGFLVLPADLQTRVFEIDYPHALRSGQSQTRVSSGQLTDQVGADVRSLVPGQSTTGGDGRGVLESSRVTTESAADFWDELELSLRAIVGRGEDRSVVVSPQASLVLVRAMPEELRQVERYLTQARSNAARQVILEANILEVELSDGYQTGVNWALLIESGAKQAILSQTGGGTLLADGVSEIAGNTGMLDPNGPSFPGNTDTSAFGGVFSAVLDLDNFTAFVELLETQGDVRVLSNPRVSTLNNQKAVIKVGQDEFFVTDVSTTTVTGTSTTSTPNVTLTPFFSGIALDVLPQIDADGDVILHVHPSVSRVEDQNKEISVGLSGDLSLPLALSTIRETDTIVRARSGQVVVIGGLMQEFDDYDRASIPLLGRIPYIGPHLFGQQRNATRKSELVILLRPRVVRDEDWREETDRTRRRLGEAFGERAASDLLSSDGRAE